MGLSKEKRLKRAQEGICLNCGKPSDRVGYIYCSQCADAKKRRYYLRKSQGLCVDCGEPTETGNIRCGKCRAINADTRREEYKSLKEMNLCTKCKMYTAAPGRTKCEVCLAIDAEKSARQREKDPEKEEERRIKRKEYMRRKRAEAKANGMCVTCMKREAAKGFKTCLDCRQKNINAQRRISREQGRVSYEEAIDKGLCTSCRREKATHGKLCDGCYEKSLANLEKANAAERPEHWWVHDNQIAFLARARRSM